MNLRIAHESEQGRYTHGRGQGSKYGRMDPKTAYANEQGRYADGREQGSKYTRMDPKKRTKMNRAGVQTVENRIQSTPEWTPKSTRK